MSAPEGWPLFVEPDRAEVVRAVGAEMRLKVTNRWTAAPIAVWEELAPPGYAPPLHVHTREDEIFRVLDGEFTMWCRGKLFCARPGAVIALPRGEPHTFKNTGGTPGRLLIMVTPGGVEGFFREVDKRALRLPVDMAEIVKAAAGFGLEILGPNPID
jgi:mannose-6-phosphate isomerase-like protein (cupin superfamily)